MNNHRFAVAALAAALICSPAFAPVALAADNMTVKDSTGATITMRSKDVGSGLQATVHVPFDSAGGDMTDTALHALRVEGVAGGVAQAISGSVGLTGTLPAFAATPSFTLGAAIPTGGNVVGVVGNTQGSTTSGQSGPLVQGAVTSGAPSYTTAQTSPLSLDTAGNLRVNLITGALPTGAATAANQATANASLATIASSVASPIPAGTAIIGGSYGFQNSAGMVLPPAADASAAINVSTATTTQLVALSSGKKIYVSALDVIAGGTGNITFVYGTGSSCGTGTTSLTGAYNLTAQAGLAKGNGLGAVLVVPASNALCVTTSAAVQMSGSVAYAQY